MNLHSGARSCPASRALLIERIRRGERVTDVAAAAGISRRTAYKWIARHAREGEAGLRDRSSRPRHSPTALAIDRVCCIVWLRETRMTMARIAASLEMPRSTVARVLQRRGLNRLKAWDAQEPPRRYTRQHPGGGALSLTRDGSEGTMVGSVGGTLRCDCDPLGRPLHGAPPCPFDARLLKAVTAHA